MTGVEGEDTVPPCITVVGKQLTGHPVCRNTNLDNLFSTRGYERVTRRYTVRCNVRGVHKFGPTVMRSGDVFGFLSNEKTLPNWQYLLVYPLVVPLTQFSLPSRQDRKSTRLNSSHANISYAVFCLKKKKKK